MGDAAYNTPATRRYPSIKEFVFIAAVVRRPNDTLHQRHSCSPRVSAPRRKRNGAGTAILKRTPHLRFCVTILYLDFWSEPSLTEEEGLLSTPRPIMSKKIVLRGCMTFEIIRHVPLHYFETLHLGGECGPAGLKSGLLNSNLCSLSRLHSYSGEDYLGWEDRFLCPNPSSRGQ